MRTNVLQVIEDCWISLSSAVAYIESRMNSREKAQEALFDKLRWAEFSARAGRSKYSGKFAARRSNQGFNKDPASLFHLDPIPSNDFHYSSSWEINENRITITDYASDSVAIHDDVHLRKSDLERFWPHTGDNEISSPSVEKSVRRGRPPYPWEEFYIEVIRLANHPDGLPDTQADLERIMLDWCELTWRKEVGPSTVKDRLSPIYRALKPRPEI